MKKLDRRFTVSVFAILALFILGFRGADVSMAIASVACGLAAANAYQKRGNTDE